MADPAVAAPPPVEAPPAPAEAPIAAETSEPAAAPPPAAEAPIDQAIVDRVRKQLEKEGRNALVASRIAERKAKAEAEARQKEFDARAAAFEARQRELDAREKELEDNPYGYAAKRKNKSELELYNEHTKRLLNNGAESPDDRVARLEQAHAKLEAELKRRDEQTAKEREESAKAQRAQYEQQVQTQFQTNVAQMIGEKGEWPLLKRNPQLFAKVAFDRLKAHHDSHNGELLDIPSVLGTIHSELEEDLKGYLPHLQPPQGVSDRDGAVQSAKHEAQSTPRTLTNGIASQTTGRSRAPSAKELAIEGDKILLGR